MHFLNLIHALSFTGCVMHGGGHVEPHSSSLSSLFYFDIPPLFFLTLNLDKHYFYI
uniref:Uncharacterized protein n=1 Tax=Manihot esculenta TaxID=3983 RepID=A0A2C9WRK3_MANES